MESARLPSCFGAVILAVFVNAGSLKSHPLVSWLPVDLTLLLAVLLVVATILAALKRAFIPAAVWVPIVIALSTFGGLLEPLGDYGQEKAIYFYSLTLLGMIAACFLLQDERQRSAFLTATGIIGFAVAVVVAIAPAHPAAWSTVVTLPGTNTIATSRMILAGVAAILLQGLLIKRRVRVRFALFAISAGMVLVALNTGSRGPIAAVAVGIVIALLVTRAFGRRRLRTLLLLVAIVAVGWAVAAQSATQGLGRILAFVEGQGDTSTGARSRFWELAASNIPNVPLGGGWGYFSELVHLGDGTSAYPHNSVLEITLEAGWFAGVAFVVLACTAFVRYIAASDSPAVVTMLVLFVFALVNSFVSGDVNDNRLLWVLLTVAFMVSRTKTEKAPTVRNESVHSDDQVHATALV